MRGAYTEHGTMGQYSHGCRCDPCARARDAWADEHPNHLADLLDECVMADWQVALECEIHPSALSLYRTQRRIIPDRHAGLLAAFFGVDINVIRSDPALAH